MLVKYFKALALDFHFHLFTNGERPLFRVAIIRVPFSLAIFKFSTPLAG